MNAKCIEGADPPKCFVELVMNPGIFDRISGGRGAGKTVDVSVPGDLQQKIMSTHPQQAPQIQMQCPRFIPPTFNPQSIHEGVEVIFDQIPKPGVQPHQFGMADVETIPTPAALSEDPPESARWMFLDVGHVETLPRLQEERFFGF